MQAIVEVAQGFTPFLAVTKCRPDHRSAEIEVHGSLEGQPALAPIPFALHRVETDLHWRQSTHAILRGARSSHGTESLHTRRDVGHAGAGVGDGELHQHRGAARVSGRCAALANNGHRLAGVGLDHRACRHPVHAVRAGGAAFRAAAARGTTQPARTGLDAAETLEWGVAPLRRLERQASCSRSPYKPDFRPGIICGTTTANAKTRMATTTACW